MRMFKDKQLGKKGGNIKETVGTDLQTLTENGAFRFPSTFTFIFWSFASIDGIGKGLSKNDVGECPVLFNAFDVIVFSFFSPC